MGIEAFLLKTHWTVCTGVNAVHFPLGCILWLAICCLMKCVFILHLLILYNLLLAASFHETSLRRVLLC